MAIGDGRRCGRNRRSPAGGREADRQGHRPEHEQGREEERQAWQHERSARLDRGGEEDSVQDRSDDRRHPIDARVRPLQLALLRRADEAGHEALQRRLHEADRREDEDGDDEDDPIRREAPHEEGRGSEQDPHDHRDPLAVPLDETFDHEGLHRDAEGADQPEGEPDLRDAPPDPVVRVDREDAREDLEGEVLDEDHGSETEELRVRSQQDERTERVGLPPTEPLPVLDRQGLGQEEKAVRSARHREGRRRPEGIPRSEERDESAEGRADDEPDSPGRADHAEGRGASLGRRDVRDVGTCGREARGRDARQDAADEQPFQVRREGHDHVVHAETESRQDEDGTAAVSVREGPEDGGEQELHQAEDRQEQAVDRAGRGRIPTRELFDQQRERRDRDAEPEGVQDDRDEDERQRRLSSAKGDGRRTRCGQGPARCRARFMKVEDGGPRT